MAAIGAAAGVAISWLLSQILEFPYDFAEFEQGIEHGARSTGPTVPPAGSSPVSTGSAWSPFSTSSPWRALTADASTYLAEEMRWPRTTTLRRLQRYAGSGYLTLTREGRHTYIDNTRESRRAALKMIDVLIDSIDKAEPHQRMTQPSGVDGLDRAVATRSVRT